ncbi:MAG: MoaD/ThiS family protein [Spirochaetales bacterium]|nr:MoaD/ThiS family protein [Spirochaetales bacterium]
MESLTIKIKYLVNFHEITGKKLDEISFPPGSDLYTVAAWLEGEYGIKVPAPRVLNLLNGHGWNQYPEEMKTTLNDGDTIIIMPSISGG